MTASVSEYYYFSSDASDLQARCYKKRAEAEGVNPFITEAERERRYNFYMGLCGAYKESAGAMKTIAESYP